MRLVVEAHTGRNATESLQPRSCMRVRQPPDGPSCPFRAGVSACGQVARGPPAPDRLRTALPHPGGGPDPSRRGRDGEHNTSFAGLVAGKVMPLPEASSLLRCEVPPLNPHHRAAAAEVPGAVAERRRSHTVCVSRRLLRSPSGRSGRISERRPTRSDAAAGKSGCVLRRGFRACRRRAARCGLSAPPRCRPGSGPGAVKR